ncbi:MAG: thiamine pyrophosphate-dependent enzyme, partial [Clostridia bacterium]|nr:thiamine pyrophosphate-dependent enzyme [Clostridia bacterium]
TGCGNCADVCPAKGKALIMKDAEHEIIAESENWEFAMTVKDKQGLMDPKTIKGSQLVRPLLEFNGACPGCGETPYVKLLTQLFGDRMMIANATGCSSIWGASAPSMAYSTNAEGKGPAWANSLFEDNAEFGYGMYLGAKQIREKLALLMKQALELNIRDDIKDALRKWLDAKDDGEGSKAATNAIFESLRGLDVNSIPILKDIMERKDYLIKRSVWILGGDGWAYDIGYGGVDQVLSTGDDINLFVMDTEIYSNTGGQASKSTPTSAVAKFAAAGKKVRKKDLGMMAMSYGYVYVAQIAMGANMNHTVKVLAEAENYKGPSLIIAYSPCISHGIKSGMGTSIFEEKRAVEAGYWHLYRYNPMLKEEGKNPFILESKEPTGSYKEFIQNEVRYSSLKTVFPDIADKMFDVAEEHAKERYNTYRRMADQSFGPQ